MPLQTPFGADWELPVFLMDAHDEGASRAPSPRTARRVFQLAQRCLPFTLPARHAPFSLFLSNGAGLGLDGSPSEPLWEHRTAECLDPLDFVLQVRAGEWIVQQLAEKCAAATGTQAIVSRCQVSYAHPATTHGFHESYGYDLEATPVALSSDLLQRELTGHLVSRLIYTGQGGFDTRAGGARFVVSPRALWIQHEASNDSTSMRALWHLRNEPLGQGRRQHLLLGESVASDWSHYLLVATTALIICAVAAGKNPGKKLLPQNPKIALHRVARDTSLSARIRLKSRRMLTALDMQRTYRDVVELMLRQNHELLPAWTPTALQIWTFVLDELAAGRGAGILDWPTKLAFYQRFVAEHGVDWDDLQTRESSRPEPPHSLQPLLDALETRGSSAPLADLQRSLLALDIQVSKLGGTLDKWKADGTVDFRLPAADDAQIRRATMHPPLTPTRANARGEAIRKLHDQPTATADWQEVSDGHQFLNLWHPVAGSADWVKRSWVRASGPLARVEAAFDRGDLTRAESLSDYQGVFEPMPAPDLKRRLQLWIAARAGNTAAAARALRELWDRHLDRPLWLVADSCLAHRFADIKPSAAVLSVEADQLHERGNLMAAVIREHRAAALVAHGEHAEAKRLLTRDQAAVRDSAVGTRYHLRLLGTLAELHRCGARLALARNYARKAQRLAAASNRQLEFIDFGLLPEAKVMARRSASAAITRLHDALFLSQRCQFLPGEARARLLLARLNSEDQQVHRERIKVLAAGSLSGFSFLRQVLARWDQWTHTAVDRPTCTDFWGI